MRIIGGEARGRRLFAPEGMDTRPTADMVREAVFNIIQSDVYGARVLDLFAGSGALALEALSRGAEHAVLVDSAHKAVAVIRRNIEAMGVGDRADVLSCDWRTAVSRLAGRFALVFLDPPYRMAQVYAQAMAALAAGGLLEEGALVVAERVWDAEIKLPAGFAPVTTRRYGQTAVDIAEYRPEVEGK